MKCYYCIAYVNKGITVFTNVIIIIIIIIIIIVIILSLSLVFPFSQIGRPQKS